MPSFLQDLFLSIGISDIETQLMILGLALIALLPVALRLILTMNYRVQNAVNLHYASVELKDKKDIDKIKSSLYGKAAKEYAILGERGISKIDTRAIVERELLKQNILLWNYVSLENFISKLEGSFLFIGLLFVFVAENRFLFAMVSGIVFAIMLLLGSILDNDSFKQRFISNAVFLLDREIGKFYIPDATTAIINLKKELGKSILMQAEIISQASEKMGADLSAVVRNSMFEMTNTVEEAMNDFVDKIAVIKEPLAEWKSTIEQTSSVQKQLNSSIETLSATNKTFEITSMNMNKSLNDFQRENKLVSSRMSEEIIKLNEIINVIKTYNDNMNGNYEILKEELEYIRKNQQMLESTLENYEITMQKISNGIGDSIGTAVDVHTQRSFQILNDKIMENLDKITQSNSEVISSFNEMFLQMAEHSRVEAATIVNMKEQMDVRFDELKNSK